MSWEQIIFYLFAALAVIFAFLTVTRRNAVHAALCLIFCFFFIAGTFVVLNAELLAAVQVLVYAGGVVGLMLYVIMLVRGEDASQVKQALGQKIIAAFISVLLVIQIGSIVYLSFAGKATGRLAQEMARYGNTESIGTLLYTKYIFPFEVASVLLLAAMVGAIVLAKNKLER
ncbi:MAG: NADH-quinone oxidoreductase subunit J [Deferribacteres bacterium]|nr:NADH-quinone oxidoreductase subunit J [Deferribacteres bacterium]